MLKLRKGWLLFIAVQIIVGACAGFLAVSLIQSASVPVSTSVGTISVGDLNMDQAKAKLKDYYDLFARQSKLVIKIDEYETTIRFKDIDMQFDAEKTLDNISRDAKGAISRFISGSSSTSQYSPVFTINEGKLSACIEEIFNVYESPAVPEAYSIKGGAIVYQPAVDGIKADFAALQKKVGDHILATPDKPLVLSLSDKTLFKPVPAEADTKGQFGALVSSARIPLGDKGAESARAVFENINGRVYQAGEQIVLSELVDYAQYNGEAGRDFVNRIATAFYQSMLPIKGMKVINRRNAKFPVPYAEPGLEAVIEGENGDLKLENQTGQALMLLSEIEEDALVLYVVAADEIPAGILISQKRDITPPPVIESVNTELEKGETRVLSEGNEGFTAYVSLVIGNEREELYSDQYEPVSRVVEVGPEKIKTGSK